MIYLKNNTILQELYIPRQDYISNTTGSSGTYAEGYADGYESGYTSGSTDGFDSGYTEGYSSGETHQKGLLTSTGITENGEYQREDGWSAITVNVSGSVLEGKEIVVSEDITIVTPDSGYGGFSAVTVDATEYGQTNYDSGFDDGYTDGYSSGSSEGYDSGYTEGYQSGSTDGYESGYTSGQTDGYNSGYTEGYDSGSTDGFNSGYTSGETHQKSLLGTTAFTINGSYSAENGYSAITVNVPTGQTYNIEPNKPFTATSNGSYTITPTSASTTVTDRFDSDTDRYYITATTSGYPSTGHFELFYIEDEFDSSKGQIYVYIENGYLDYDDSDWYGGEIVDLSLSTNIDLFIRNANRHFDWYSLEDFYYHYDAMSAVTLNVNVPQTGTSATLGEGSFSANGTYSASTDNLDGYSAITINVPTSGDSVKYLEYIETNGTQIGWDTGYNIGTDIDAKIYLDFMPISGNGYGDYWYAYYGDCAENVLFRRAGNSSSIGFMFGNNRTKIDRSGYYVVNGNRYLISLDKNGITDENTGTLLVAASSSYINSTKNLYLNCEGFSGNNQVYRCIRARYYSFRVENGNGETTLDMRPCLDGNDVPCFYDEVSQTYIYHSGSGTPIAGPIVDESYESGYTDGYNSGYTVGTNDVISTFSSITITQNGHYGSYAHPMTSITVNVPTSGGSGYSIDQLAIRDYNINNPTISTTDIKLFAFANSNLSGMLIIGSAVTNIYAYAFSHTNISGITFPQTIVGNEYGKMVMAGSGQFEYCANLTSVNIPSYIEFTDNARARNTYGIFEECRNLVSVNWDADRVPTYCFRYCSSLSAINLTNVTNIDDYSFMNCGSLSSITIPSVCTRIGNGAFGNCSSLNEINVLATTAPTLGVAAFMNTPTGTVHYPQGSDYSSWQSNQYLSGWTFVGDL